ncbi:unnamed protein product [Coregonus sp. 'balchen']|nr:unnamed protein product [Coregonus sp. 'balchen']
MFVSLQHVLDTNCTIKTVCGVMSKASLGDPYHHFTYFVRLRTRTTFLSPVLKASRTTSTFRTSGTHIIANPTAGRVKGGEGQRIPRRGSEGMSICGMTGSMGLSPLSSPSPSSLSIPSLSGRYHVEQCQDNFNISAKTLYSGIDQTKKNYSSYNIRATRIVFPNSSIDPWHALGITSSISDDLPAIFIKGTAHCANMYPARAEDHPQLTLAREHVFQLLQTWLKEK